MLDRHSNAVGIVFLIALKVQPVTGPDHRAWPGSQDGCAFWSGHVDAGMRLAVEQITVAIARQGPIDLVGGDGTGEVEVIVWRGLPGYRIQRGPPEGDRLGAGCWKSKL